MTDKEQKQKELIKLESEDLLSEFKKNIETNKDYEGCECECELSGDTSRKIVTIKRKNHFRAQIKISFSSWNDKSCKELNFYKITKYGGYEYERTSLSSYECPIKTIPKELILIINKIPIITEFEEKPKKVRNIPIKPYEFKEVEEQITRNQKGLRFCQENYISSGTIDVVGLKEGGKIEVSREELANPNSESEMWFYINFTTMKQRYGQLLFDGVDKFFPVQGSWDKNTLRITKGFASPYIDITDLNTADRNNFCRLAQALKEDFDASNQKTG